MATIRRIRGNFISSYVKPDIVERAVEQILPTTLTKTTTRQPVRRELDRRCGRDRRQRAQPILLDLRSSQARRKTSRRGMENDSCSKGIDTYA